MAFSLVAHTSQVLGPNGGTVTGFNTSGCDLIVVGVSDFAGAPSTGWISDSLSQAHWTMTAPDAESIGNVKGFFFYAWNATGGASHTFTLTATGVYISCSVFAFSGSQTSSDPLDQLVHLTGGQDSGQLTAQASSTLTPGFANELLVSLVSLEAAQSSAPTIDSSFASPATEFQQFASSVDIGTAMSWQVQTTITARNPTWTFDSATSAITTMASFKAGAAPTIVPVAPGIQLRQAIKRSNFY